MPQRHCVLFIEDEAEAVEAFHDAFSRLSDIYALHVVKSAGEAISYIKGIGKYGHRREYPMPTVMVTGPGEDRLRAVEWLRGQAELECVRVVVLVDSEDEQTIARAYLAGAHSCLVKADDFEELREILLLVGHYWMECNHVPSLSRPISQD
jgi:DNA-binding NarL/FixJ family response regulator